MLLTTQWKLAAAVVAVGALTIIPSVKAAPIPAAPGPFSAGESELTSFVTGLASDLTVDWMVVPYTGGLVSTASGVPVGPIPAGGFLYAYQLENTTGQAIDAYSVTLPAGVVGSVAGAGIIGGDDLDLPTAIHPAHAGTVIFPDGPVAGPFPILDGPPVEEGPFALGLLGAPLTSVDFVNGNVSWTFDPFAAGLESETLFFVSPIPPIYGNAVAQDSTPPAPWGSLAPGGEPVPVPAVPEPAALGLAGIGLLGLARRSARR